MILITIPVYRTLARSRYQSSIGDIFSCLLRLDERIPPFRPIDTRLWGQVQTHARLFQKADY